MKKKLSEYIVPKKQRKSIPAGLTFRPEPEVVLWLEKLSEKYEISINKLISYILKKQMDEEE